METKYKKWSEFCAFLREVLVTFVMFMMCAMFLCAVAYFMFAVIAGGVIC